MSFVLPDGTQGNWVKCSVWETRLLLNRTLVVKLFLIENISFSSSEDQFSGLFLEMLVWSTLNCI